MKNERNVLYPYRNAKFKCRSCDKPLCSEDARGEKRELDPILGCCSCLCGVAYLGEVKAYCKECYKLKFPAEKGMNSIEDNINLKPKYSSFRSIILIDQ